MNECPSAQEILDLLTDRLPPEVEAQLAAHVEICPRCLAELEELTALPQPEPAAAPQRTGRAGGLGRLRGLVSAARRAVPTPAALPRSADRCRPDDEIGCGSVVVDGVRVPRFLYGTAWKEDQTQRLTVLALRHGFRGIDTANQRKHYHEAAVGQAVAAAVASGLVTREDLFLQTKFTFASGQDHRLPYDPKAAIRTQVEQSFASSQEHLGVEVIDAYLLHGPTRRSGLAAADWEAWRAMEACHDRGGVRLLGVSNVTLEQLRRLFEGARVPPRFVQNRCYATRGWDRDVRAYCAAHGIVYQGFSLLTANRDVMAHPELTRIAGRHNRTVSQVVFRFALDVGMAPLTGTTDAGHMREDLEVFEFRLEPGEVERIERLASP